MCCHSDKSLLINRGQLTLEFITLHAKMQMENSHAIFVYTYSPKHVININILELYVFMLQANYFSNIIVTHTVSYIIRSHKATCSIRVST